MTISYRDLDASSTAFALWFLDQGLRPGERVAILWSNSIEVVQLLFALFNAGLIAVTVNVRLKAVRDRLYPGALRGAALFQRGRSRAAGAASRRPVSHWLRAPSTRRGERQHQTAHDQSG